MPRVNTLDRRQSHNITWELCDMPSVTDFDPDNNLNTATAQRIVEDTNQRHNREAPHHNVDALTNNTAMRLNIPRSNLDARPSPSLFCMLPQ
jgi:hypothetical protein